jgi:hypothetical protein
VGHFFDSANVHFLYPDEGKATVTMRYSGLQNIDRGCGLIGSVKLRLEITLPDDRSSVRDCLTNPTRTRTLQLHERIDIPNASDSMIPEVKFSLRGGTGAGARISGSTGGQQIGNFELDRDFALTMLGVLDFEVIATNFARQERKLKVLVKSELPHGVTRVAPATGLVAFSPGAISGFNPARIARTGARHCLRRSGRNGQSRARGPQKR